MAPFLEELATKSVVFRHAHSTSSWTAPAVASLFTSLYPAQHGVRTGLIVGHRLGIEVNRLPDDLMLLPELFQHADYATLGISDNVNISRKLGFGRGFDRFHEMNDEGAEHVSAIALDWLDDIRERSRTFLYLHFLDPHRPYHERNPWFDEFRVPGNERIARYDSEIRHVDAHIAELFGRFGWDEDTLLVILSDHGEEFGDHGSDNHGHTLYSELIDIPLMMYCPRLWPTGQVVESRVSIVDIFPTLAAICGLKMPPECQGSSVLDLIAGDFTNSTPLYSHLERRDLGSPPDGLVMRSEIFGNRKLILSNAGTRQFFDLAADPSEQHDRAVEWAELADALEGLMMQFESGLKPRFGEVEHIEIDQKLREQLKALGYVEMDDGGY